MKELAKDILIEKGVSPSYHRLKVLEYLLENRNHPSADDIYRKLIEEIPTLSKTTIYNTLKTFVESGLVESFNILQNEVRYEYNLNPHAHFLCKKCGKIYDLPDYDNCLKNQIIAGHEIHDHQINLSGICKNCREKE